MTKRKQSELSNCACCGMPVPDGPHYHPYAACMMYMHCRSVLTVEANLWAVVEYGKSLTGKAVRAGRRKS